MNKLISGTEYRALETGYVLRRGKREVYINAKSVDQGKKAREIIAKYSFNKIFMAGKKMGALGDNVRVLFI